VRAEGGGCAGVRYAAGWEMLLDTHTRLVLPYYLLLLDFRVICDERTAGSGWIALVVQDYPLSLYVGNF